MAADRRLLELHGRQYRVTLAVPRDLHKVLGTRLKRSLRTDSLALANRLKHQAVAEMRAEIDHARGLTAKRPDALMREALEIAAYLKRATDARSIDEILEGIREREEALGKHEFRVYEEAESGQQIPEWAPVPTPLSSSFGNVARGRATPLALMHEEYLGKSLVKARTKADDVRAIRYLTIWCDKNGIPPMLENITRKLATRFVDDLGTVTGGLHPRTQNKYVGRLSGYWKYMLKREQVEADVWSGLSVPVPATPHEEEERAFTDEEVRLLLNGPATESMRDLILFGALTGARLDAIVDLKVKDTRSAVITFKKQKKEKTARDIPVHPDLKEIVARRSTGKAENEPLFPEWPAPKKAGSMRERSFKASNEFTTYRRLCGVEEQVEGKRRSLVNFHSFRRWFITKAERAGKDKDLIAAIVGHKRSGITLGRYSEGPEMRRARACVAAVKLPLLDRIAPESRALTPRKRGDQ